MDPSLAAHRVVPGSRRRLAPDNTEQTTSPILSARSLACGYGSPPILRDIDLYLRPGELVAVLGQNGCGKSTLLRTLAGILPAHHGTVSLTDQPLSRLPRRTIARLMAVVPQELSVPFPFSVREVIALGRSPYAHFMRGPDQEDIQAIEHALAATDLVALADRLYQEISGGEQQRAAVAMALAQEPRVLLLDEPTVHLDIAHQTSILSLLHRLCRQDGLAVLAAMHDINVTCLYADRLIVLGEGRVLASGSPSDVLSLPLIERAFGARVVIGRHPTLDVPQVSLVP